MITNHCVSKNVLPEILEYSDFMDIVSAVITAIIILIVLLLVVLGAAILLMVGLVGMGFYYEHVGIIGGKVNDSR